MFYNIPKFYLHYTNVHRLLGSVNLFAIHKKKFKATFVTVRIIT